MDQKAQERSLENTPDLPNLELTLCRGRTVLHPTADSKEENRCESILDVDCTLGILAFFLARNERIFG